MNAPVGPKRSGTHKYQTTVRLVFKAFQHVPCGRSLLRRNAACVLRPRQELANRLGFVARLALGHDGPASFHQTKCRHVKSKLVPSRLVQQFDGSILFVVGRRCIPKNPVGFYKDVPHSSRAGLDPPRAPCAHFALQDRGQDIRPDSIPHRFRPILHLSSPKVSQPLLDHEIQEFLLQWTLA